MQAARYFNPTMQGKSRQTPEDIEKKEQHLAEKIVQQYDVYLAAETRQSRTSELLDD